jgi:two-component sensor histidine kinase
VVGISVAVAPASALQGPVRERQASVGPSRPRIEARWLEIVVTDDGRGLPAGFDLESSDRLGLQIVRTLMSAELDGSLAMRPADGGGTDVVVRVPIGRRAGRGTPA